MRCTQNGRGLGRFLTLFTSHRLQFTCLSSRVFWRIHCRRNLSSTANSPWVPTLQEGNINDGKQPILSLEKPSGLPSTCPGCGAYSQTQNPSEPGFYDESKRRVKAFLSSQNARAQAAEDAMFDRGLKEANPSLLATLRISSTDGLGMQYSPRISMCSSV